jgi:hypothetical protein
MISKRTHCSDAYLRLLGLSKVPEMGTRQRVDFDIVKHMDTNGFGSARTLCTVAHCSSAMLGYRMRALRDRGIVRRVHGGAEAVALGCVCLLAKRRAYTLTATARREVWQHRLRQRAVSKLGKAPKRTRAGRW